MRGSSSFLGRRNPISITIGSQKPNFIQPFSTFSGRGRGRGGGGGGPASTSVDDGLTRAPGKPQDGSPSFRSPAADSGGLGRGHGRGKPVASSATPFLPSFSGIPPPTGDAPSESQSSGPRKPIFFRRDESSSIRINVRDDISNPIPSPMPKFVRGESDLPSGIGSPLGGGRGKPPVPPVSRPQNEVNRHRRPRAAPGQASSRGRGDAPRLSREEATRKAVDILARGVDNRRRGRAFSDSRGRGRGRGRGFYRYDSSEDENPDDKKETSDEHGELDDFERFFDDGDCDKIVNKLGPERAEEFKEAFEGVIDRVLPDTERDAMDDAVDMTLRIHLEPEYLMEEFGTNPDIDDKPPIPLRDALEKMKPFLMVYEGIESQEEWEEVVQAAMDRVPYLKQLVDHYSGPDRVTAKQQQQELERVANTLPASAPYSIRRFADRAVLSLQSNPGWGWDKKCQFMDKLVAEVSQHYK